MDILWDSGMELKNRTCYRHIYKVFEILFSNPTPQPINTNLLAFFTKTRKIHEYRCPICLSKVKATSQEERKSSPLAAFKILTKETYKHQYWERESSTLPRICPYMNLHGLALKISYWDAKKRHWLTLALPSRSQKERLSLKKKKNKNENRHVHRYQAQVVDMSSHSICSN